MNNRGKSSQHLLSLQARTDTRNSDPDDSIFMPLTLIAGIYRMNFSQTPELQLSWGYRGVC